MKKVYISPVIAQEKFETADIITVSMQFTMNNYDADTQNVMPEINVKDDHFKS